MRAGEVIAKLAEDAYFTRVDNRVTQVPPVRNHQQDNEATSRSAADNGRNHTRGELPANPNRTRASAGGPSHGATAPVVPAATAISSLTAILVSEAATAGAPHTERAGELGAEATAAAKATRTAMPPVHHEAASTPAKKSKNYDAKNPPRQATTTASPPSPHSFAIYFSQRNSNHWGSPSTTRSKIQYSGSDVTPSPSRTLVAIMTQSACTFPSTWIKLHLHGSSHSRSTRSTSGTSSRTSSPATSRALWVARVLAWTWQW
jgi:hypothetical protein